MDYVSSSSLHIILTTYVHSLQYSVNSSWVAGCFLVLETSVVYCCRFKPLFFPLIKRLAPPDNLIFFTRDSTIKKNNN